MLVLLADSQSINVISCLKRVEILIEKEEKTVFN